MTRGWRGGRGGCLFSLCFAAGGQARASRDRLGLSGMPFWRHGRGGLAA
jgi:hypothetical protein